MLRQRVITAVILMAGLQGAGKTTTTAKLARHLILKRKKKVLTVSADVYRPAAIEQLKTVSAQAQTEWFPSAVGQKPVDIVMAALEHAQRHYFDVLLVDTAGRLAIDEALMLEIQQLHQALNPVTCALGEFTRPTLRDTSCSQFKSHWSFNGQELKQQILDCCIRRGLMEVLKVCGDNGQRSNSVDLSEFLNSSECRVERVFIRGVANLCGNSDRETGERSQP